MATVLASEVAAEITAKAGNAARLNEDSMPTGLSAKVAAYISGVPASGAAFDFLSSETLDPKITASGGTNGTRINNAGTIVAATTPRYDYDPVSLRPLGVLVEEARTNLFTGSAVGGAGLITQGVTVTAAPTTISFYGTGTMVLSGAYSATLVGKANFPQRTVLTFTPSAGALLCTVTGSVQWAQCETGAFPTSFIPSAGTATTRAADLLTCTGTNFSSWFNPAAGTFVSKCDLYSLAPPCAVFQADAGDYNNRIVTYDSAGALADSISVGGAQAVALNPGITLTAGVPFGSGFAYQINDAAGSVNGSTPVTGAPATLPTPTRLLLGRDDTGALMLNGHLRSFSYYPSRLNNGQLQYLSASGLVGVGAGSTADRLSELGFVDALGAELVAQVGV
jgi:hypothetical protein